MLETNAVIQLSQHVDWFMPRLEQEGVRARYPELILKFANPQEVRSAHQLLSNAFSPYMTTKAEGEMSLKLGPNELRIYGLKISLVDSVQP